MRQERLALAVRRFGDCRDVIEVQPGVATATVAAVGDVSLHAFAAGDSGRIARAAASLRDVLGAPDLATGNLESVLTRRDARAGRLGSFLRAAPEAVGVVADGALHVVTCANNHCLDFGAAALAESVDTVRRAGVEVCGVGETTAAARRPVIRSVGGLRVGVLAYTDDWRPQAACGFLPAGSHDDDILADVTALRTQVDLLILHLHWGWEWVLHPLRSHRDRARRYAEAGADLVLCHHAHVPMAVEPWGRSLIAHGLGNFLFPFANTSSGALQHHWRDRSYLLHVGVSAAGVHSARIVPVELGDGGVRRSTGGRRREILGGLAALRRALADDRRLAALELDRVVREGRTLATRLLDLARAGDRPTLEEAVALLRTPRGSELVAALGRVPDGAGDDFAALLDAALAGDPAVVEHAARDGRLLAAFERLSRSPHWRPSQPGRVP